MTSVNKSILKPILWLWDFLYKEKETDELLKVKCICKKIMEFLNLKTTKFQFPLKIFKEKKSF